MAKLYFNPDGSFNAYDPGPLAAALTGLASVDFDPTTNPVLLSYTQSGRQTLLTLVSGTVVFAGNAVTVNAPSAIYSNLQEVMGYIPQLQAGTPLDQQQTINLQLAALEIIQQVVGAQ